MTAHIDWLTIVGHRRTVDADWTLGAAYNDAVDTLVDCMPTFMEVFGSPLRYQIVKPRAPYSYARRSDDCTRTLYVHPLAAHFTFEVSGSFCSRNAEHMPAILRAFGGMLSRIDLAVDMDCAVTPLEFEAAIVGGASQTRSQFVSTTGQTVYRGSRTSERFARIYRYNPPHPRSHLLRAEFQLKGGYANALAKEASEGTSLDSLAAGLGQVFGFQHSVWSMAKNPVQLAVSSHAHSGATVYWLTATVAPLLRRLQTEGKLDTVRWFETYVSHYE